MTNETRDLITIEDENGNEKQFELEALFDMDTNSYALMRQDEDILLMRIENEGDNQYLIGLTDETEKESILAAYEVAIQAAPAE